MTTYNTGNPLGSSDPKDLYDNAQNLDAAVNSTDSTFSDRLGRTRLTWKGIQESGTGDTAIAVDAAQRSEDAADRAELAESNVEANAESIAENAANLAVADVVAAVDGSVAEAEGFANAAEAARDAALLSKGLWPTTAAGIGNGVAGATITSGGSGGTNGTFALAFSGGTQVLAPAGVFTVVGGAVVSVTITYSGYYSAGTPTFSFAASAGLTGTNITAVMARNTDVNEYFSVPVSNSGDSLILYRVDAGPVATEVTRYPSSNKVNNAVALAVPWLAVLEQADGSYIIPAFQYERDLGLVWINGRVDTVANALTDHGDGSYTLNQVPTGLANGVTVFFDWTQDGFMGTPTGTFLSLLANTISLQSEVGVEAALQTTVLGFRSSNRAAAAVQQITRGRKGITRGMIMVPANGGTARYATEDQDLFVGAASTQYNPAVAMAINRRPAPGSPNVLANAAVTRAIVYPLAMTDAQINQTFADIDLDPAPEVQVYPHWLAVLDEGNGEKIVPSFQVDWKRNRCWYKGRERAITDVMVQEGDGSWTMIKPPPGLRTTTGLSVFVDVRPDDYYTFAAPPSGFAYAFSDARTGPVGTTQRLELGIGATGVTAPGGLFTTSAFASRLSEAFSSSGLLTVPFRGQGILRSGIVANVTGKYYRSINGDLINETTNSAISYEPQDYFRFGNNYAGASVLTNCDLEQAIIYSQELTKPQMLKAMLFNEYKLPPLWFVGDSLNNNQQPAEGLRLHLANAGATYLPMLSNGQGGRGLSFFEEYIESFVALYDELRDYMLVLGEGGFDYQSLDLAGTTTVGPYTELDIQNYIKNIFRKFRNPNKCYMEGHSNAAAEAQIANPAGGAYAKLLNTMANIRASWPDYFVPTNALLQAQALTDADYNAFRVDGRTPVALREDGIHLKWGSDPNGSDNGYFWWSLSLLTHLQNSGWNPKKP